MKMPEKKVIRINVYLSNEDKKTLNEIKYKYFLSYSTIAWIIALCMNVDIDNKDLEKNYIYDDKEKTYKTSIKPRKLGIVDIEKPTIYYTNVLKLYLRKTDKKLNKYLDEKKLTKLDKDIHKLFAETKDTNWNGNEWNRQLPKWIKQNKEYYKKLLEQD